MCCATQLAVELKQRRRLSHATSNLTKYCGRFLAARADGRLRPSRVASVLLSHPGRRSEAAARPLWQTDAHANTKTICCIPRRRPSSLSLVRLRAARSGMQTSVLSVFRLPLRVTQSDVASCVLRRSGRLSPAEAATVSHHESIRPRWNVYPTAAEPYGSALGARRRGPLGPEVARSARRAGLNRSRPSSQRQCHCLLIARTAANQCLIKVRRVDWLTGNNNNQS